VRRGRRPHRQSRGSRDQPHPRRRRRCAATLTGTEFTPETAAAVKKLDECLKRLSGLNGNGRAVKAREYLKGRVMDVRKRLLGIAS
jgi:hypothetical protein